MSMFIIICLQYSLSLTLLQTGITWKKVFRINIIYQKPVRKSFITLCTDAQIRMHLYKGIPHIVQNKISCSLIFLMRRKIVNFETTLTVVAFLI